MIESAKAGFSAYVPDLDGCVAIGRTLEDLGQNIRGAIKHHLQRMREYAEVLPGFDRANVAVIEIYAAR